MSHGPYQSTSAPNGHLLHHQSPNNNLIGNQLSSVQHQSSMNQGGSGMSYGQTTPPIPMQTTPPSPMQTSSPINGPSLSPMGPPSQPYSPISQQRSQFMPNSPQMNSTSPQGQYPQVSPHSQLMTRSMPMMPPRMTGPGGGPSLMARSSQLHFNPNSFGGQPPSNFNQQLSPQQTNQPPPRPMTVQQQLQYHQQQLQSMGQRPRMPPPPQPPPQYSPASTNQRSPMPSSPSHAAYQPPRKDPNSQQLPPSSSSYSGSVQLQSKNIASTSGFEPPTAVIDKNRLQDLVTEIDPTEQLDEDVEDMLLQMTDDFVENLVTASAQLAKHRGSSALEVSDVQLILEKNWNMYIPGFGPGPVPSKRAHHQTEAHKQRLSLIRKTIKKF